MTAPVWSVLIAHAAGRARLLARLLDILAPQCDQAAGRAEVIAYRNPGGLSIDGLAKVRQALLDEARGQWVSYCDDDDAVDPGYIGEVLAAIDAAPAAAYVAFPNRYCDVTTPGAYLLVRTGLAYGGWHTTMDGLICDITHINPVRAEYARQAGWAPGPGWEDRRYVAALREALAGQAEAVITRPLYDYRHNPACSVQTGTVPAVEPGPLPEPPGPWFRWHPDST